MDTDAERIREMSARPVVHDYSEPDFVRDGQIVRPGRPLRPLVYGLVHNAFVGSIVASYCMYRLPEVTPWLVVAMGSKGARLLVSGPRTNLELDCLPPWTTEMCGAILRAGAMGPILGRPAAELTDRCVDLEDVLGIPGRDLRHRIEDARSTSERLVLLEQGLVDIARAADASATPASVAITSSLARRAPVKRLSELERFAGWSQRHLRRLFRRDVGLAPKGYLRLLRFSRVIERLRTTRTPHWSDLSVALGYADQAHLITEFRHFVGVSPTAFLADPGSDRSLRHGAVPRPRL